MDCAEVHRAGQGERAEVRQSVHVFPQPFQVVLRPGRRALAKQDQPREILATRRPRDGFPCPGVIRGGFGYGQAAPTHWNGLG
ncbi:MAG: hypothetical protein KDJ54_08700 [Candidatus Competibacteraceae bacterium]|nr:hypothetical protein [Candidatus Competibacteraceae bacterium]